MTSPSATRTGRAAVTRHPCAGAFVTAVAFCGALCALGGCSAPPARDPLGARDPVALVAKADELARAGQYDDALGDYLWALDHGKEVNSDFGTERKGLVEKVIDLGLRYPPARTALAERLDSEGKRILRAAEGGQRVDASDLTLFVWLGTRIGDEARVRATHGLLKARLPPDDFLRLFLWIRIEQSLVEQRRYREAVAEQDGSALMKYYLTVFNGRGADETRRWATQAMLDGEGGPHFEALVGAGQLSDAETLAEQFVKFAPTGHMFAVLIRHARRAGAMEVATRLRAKAYAIVPESERKIVDEAMNEVMKLPG